MNLALHNLYPSLAGCSLSATHKYYRFLPKDPAEYDQIELIAGDEIWEYPIDYSITTYGNYYHDPTIAIDKMTWQYAVVPASATVPANITHEFIYDMFLSKIDAVTVCGETVSFEDLEEESYELTGNFDTTIEDADFKKKPQFFPEGDLKVFNNELNAFEPLRGVHVQSFRFGNSDFTHTDVNGHFKINTGYKKSVSMRVKFTSSLCDVRAVKDITKNISASVMRADIGSFSGASLQTISFGFADDTDPTTFKKMFWAGCQYMNSVIEHRDFCFAKNISPAHLHLSVYLTSDAQGSSAPMLKRMGNTSLLLGVIQLSMIGTGNPGPIAAAFLTKVAQQYLPDQTIDYPFGSGNNTDVFQQMCYHELGHSMYYEQVSNWYWTQIISFIINHGGYGNVGDNNFELVVLSEGWAEYFGSIVAHNKYKNVSVNGNGFGSWLNNIEKFDKNWDRYPEGFGGFMHDLTDDSEPVSPNQVDDSVNQYNTEEIFDVINQLVTSPDIYKNALLQNSNNKQKVEVDKLYTSYGF